MAESTSSEKRIAATERQRQAVELRKAGVGFEEIAQRLGYGGPSGAYNAVKAALRKTIQQPADELRALELARLDALLLGIWADARKGNVLKIDRVLKIMAKRAEYLGLDAPKRYKDETDRRKEAETIAAEIGKADDPAIVAQIEADLQRGNDRLLSQEVR